MSTGLKRSLLNMSKSKKSTDLTPIKWTKYFDREGNVHTKNGRIHYYAKGDNGVLLLLIHGGGYNALTWSLFVEEITSKVVCQVIAIDLRKHGSTEIDSNDLSLEAFTQDLIDFVDELFVNTTPPIILIGHSLGGAIAVDAASKIAAVEGICVIDIVEGTAMECLSTMQYILSNRPSGFSSIEEAILWCYKSRQTSNIQAARVSMPGQIINLSTNKLAANEDFSQTIREEVSIKDISFSETSIQEEEEEVEVAESQKHVAPLNLKPPSDHLQLKQYKQKVLQYKWRIDLSKTEPFWMGWFQGMSQKFIDLPISKVLLLANLSMDTALTRAQMEGKFQFQVLQRAGHTVQEDQPENVADIMADFLIKRRLSIAKDSYSRMSPIFY